MSNSDLKKARDLFLEDLDRAEEQSMRQWRELMGLSAKKADFLDEIADLVLHKISLLEHGILTDDSSAEDEDEDDSSIKGGWGSGHHGHQGGSGDGPGGSRPGTGSGIPDEMERVLIPSWFKKLNEDEKIAVSSFAGALMLRDQGSSQATEALAIAHRHAEHKNVNVNMMIDRGHELRRRQVAWADRKDNMEALKPAVAKVTDQMRKIERTKDLRSDTRFRVQNNPFRADGDIATYKPREAMSAMASLLKGMGFQEDPWHKNNRSNERGFVKVGTLQRVILKLDRDTATDGDRPAKLSIFGQLDPDITEDNPTGSATAGKGGVRTLITEDDLVDIYVALNGARGNGSTPDEGLS